MEKKTEKDLNEAGFVSGSVSEFLGLTTAQENIVEVKVRLTALLREERKLRKWSQTKLAEELGSRQQVIARAEMGHRSVTLDLLFRALLTLGVGLGQIADELRNCEKFVKRQQAVATNRSGETKLK